MSILDIVKKDKRKGEALRVDTAAMEKNGGGNTFNLKRLVRVLFHSKEGSLKSLTQQDS